MYFIIIRQETVTGYLEADLSNKPPEAIPDWPITEVIEFTSHSYAVNKFITVRSDFSRYNKSINPDYTPRTKRLPT